MSIPTAPTNLIDYDGFLICLACGDPFSPEGVAEGNLPILFTCGHTVCVDCAKNVALALPHFDGKWACGWCKRGDGGAVNAGVIALVQSMATSVNLGPALSRFQTDMEPAEEASAPLDFSALTVEAGAAVASALSDLERVNSARRTMRAGFESSRATFIADIDSMLSAIVAHRDRVLGEAKQLLDAREKVLGTQVEELSVKASLLRQALGVCQAVMAGTVDRSLGVYDSVRKGVKGVAGVPFGGLAVPPVASIGIITGTEDILKHVEASVYIKRGVSAPECEVSGPGLELFAVGGPDARGVREQNVLRLVCRDDTRAVVDVDARDVSVFACWTGDGDRGPAASSVTVVPLFDAPGVFGAVYAVESDDVDAVHVDVRVYGEPVARSPFRVCKALFAFSAVLLPVAVDPSTLLQFTLGVRTWLPCAGTPVLLFRMSRDGTKTSDFHSRCDGKASTVVLIRSTNGFVFGGYAGAAWNNRNDFIRCKKSFIFTVCNPHGIPPTRYLVNDQDHAVGGHGEYGPRFGANGIRVGAGDGSLTSESCTPFNHYTDTTGKGAATFTGVYRFTAAEVEVWQM